MLNPAWLFRMAKWARRPPSPARVKLVFAVLLIAAGIYGIEWLGWWPNWAQTQRIPRLP